MEFKLVPAEENDKNYLLELRKSTMVEHLEKEGVFLSDEEHMARISIDYDCCHILFLSSIRNGMVKFKELPEKIKIIQVQIDPDAQGKGVGRKVIEHVIAKYPQKDIVLSVLKSNPAKRLYERIGFFVVSEDDFEFNMKLPKT